MLTERSSQQAAEGQPEPSSAEAVEWPVFHRGDRVAVPEDMIGLQLTVTTGVVVGADPEWDGYYLVQLDQPARDLRSDTEVPVVREAADNITPLYGVASVEAAD